MSIFINAIPKSNPPICSSIIRHPVPGANRKRILNQCWFPIEVCIYFFFFTPAASFEILNKYALVSHARAEKRCLKVEFAIQSRGWGGNSGIKHQTPPLHPLSSSNKSHSFDELFTGTHTHTHTPAGNAILSWHERIARWVQMQISRAKLAPPGWTFRNGELS